MNEQTTTPAARATSQNQPNPRARAGPARLVIGIVFLAVAIVAAAMMALEHLAGLRLPGCGPGSPCAEASQSAWGSVPYVNWPVSYLGLAYFAGLLVAWVSICRHGAPLLLLWLVRLGLLVSVGFVLIMLLGGYPCPYCLATHLSNLGFWILIETLPRAAAPRWQPAAALAGMFVLATAALAVIETSVQRELQTVAEADAQATAAAIVAGSSQPIAESSVKPPITEVGQPLGPAPAQPTGSAASAPAGSAAAASTAEPLRRGFTGRYRLGPEAVPLRLVIFSDYTCKGCNLLEIELKQLLATSDIVSLSVKQCPMNSECNHLFSSEREHENACRAARAAEAAGLLRGNDGFWQMHHWLFDRSGRFTDDELRTALAEFDYDAAEFERVMNSDEVLQLIQADVQEAFDLGMTTTPMVFINGREFKGWSVPLNLTKLVETLKTKNLPAKTAEADQPAPAPQRYVNEWKESRVRDFPPAARAWTNGSPMATLPIIAWGDYLQPNTALADAIIREFLTSHPEAQYTFRHYPLSPECNPAVDEERYNQSCLAARAAETAGRLNGQDGFWKMHVWLMENQANFSEQTLQDALPELGFEPLAFLDAMNDPAVTEAILDDARAAQEQQLRNAPLMFVKNKVIPRWLHGSRPLLREILEAAARE